VLLNLLSNAVKYNLRGGTVTIGCAQQADGRLRIEVGPGASQRDREAARQSMPAPSDEMTQMQAPIRYDGGDQA
jgi:K+-sensing histidine kinase KdpD